jgi:hypothetical protein
LMNVIVLAHLTHSRILLGRKFILESYPISKIV